jgi:hypothetical protein
VFGVFKAFRLASGSCCVTILAFVGYAKFLTPPPPPWLPTHLLFLIIGCAAVPGLAEQQLVALSGFAVPEPSSPAASITYRVATEPEYRKVLHEGLFLTLVAMSYAQFCETLDKDMPVRTSSSTSRLLPLFTYLFSVH